MQVEDEVLSESQTAERPEGEQSYQLESATADPTPACTARTQESPSAPPRPTQAAAVRDAKSRQQPKLHTKPSDTTKRPMCIADSAEQTEGEAKRLK